MLLKEYNEILFKFRSRKLNIMQVRQRSLKNLKRNVIKLLETIKNDNKESLIHNYTACEIIDSSAEILYNLTKIITYYGISLDDILESNVNNLFRKKYKNSGIIEREKFFRKLKGEYE